MVKILPRIFKLCRMRRSRMKVKHLGAIFLFLSLFLYGIVQTLYLLSPAIERLSKHIFHTNQHKLDGMTAGPNTVSLAAHGVSRLTSKEIGRTNTRHRPLPVPTADGSDSSRRSRGGHVLRYRVIVDKKHKLLRNPVGQGQIVPTRPRKGVINFDHSDSPEQRSTEEHIHGNVFGKSLSWESAPGQARVGSSARNCPALTHPDRIQDSKTWAVVKPDQLYVFSAFYESRLWQPAVRVIAVMAQSSRDDPGYCQMWFHDQPHPSIATVETSMVPEGHVEKRFAVFLLTCPLKTDRQPYAVAIVTQRCDLAKSHLAVLNAQSSRERMSEFTVCVTPLNYEYNNVNQLVEMIETNRLLGARRLVFYNHSTGSDLDQYLRSYVKDGVVDVIQWRIPVRVDTWPRTEVVDIHYFGQLAALNDCLYRNMYKSRFLVFSDLDELIVPKVHANWKGVLGSVQEQQRMRKFNKFGAFLFQCVFFRTDWPSDPNATAIPDANQYNILTLLKTKREKDIFPWGMRSKYIADPLKVEMVGIHNIWKFVANRYMEFNVPASLGLLHHYRFWEESSNEWTVDKTLHKFTDIIISRVRDRHEIIKRDPENRHL